jgi:CBS domain-containing protein
MKVRELMTKAVAYCHPETNLAEAGALMWENDCGVLPVVDSTGKATGVLTDRDICIALSTRNRSSSDITAGEVATSHTLTCQANDDIHAALETMRREKIHRLPVVNQTGALEGILSVNDIVLRAGKAHGKKQPEVSYDDVVRTFQALCAHRPGKSHTVAA